MATKTQKIICRRMTALDQNQFSHTDMKYKFAGWATSRENALSGIVEYTDQQQLSVNNDAPPTHLYAVWKERKANFTYENLQITASDVTYDKTTAPVFYTVTEVKTYEGFDTPYSKTVLANDVAVDSSKFLANGNPESETPTKARTQTVSYTYKDSGLVATANIVQGGYTPTFRIIVNKSKFGTVKCTTGNKPLTIEKETADAITYASTSKNFTLQAVPKTAVDKEWISMPACAYYKKDYATRLKHAATYPKSNGCGSWKTTTTKLYNFTSWSGGNIDGNTKAQVVLQGSVVNPPTVSANYVRIPLLKNTILGAYWPYWQTAKHRTEKYTAYRKVSTWVPTCKTGLKYLRNYGINTMHEGKSGHGYYKASWEPYTATRTITTYTNHKNKFYGASNRLLPYVLYIPADGVLKIKGRFGTAVYGGVAKENTGGFAIKKYDNDKNVYDTFLNPSGTSNAANDYSDVLSLEFVVHQGQKYQFSGILAGMAIWIESIELIEKTT